MPAAPAALPALLIAGLLAWLPSMLMAYSQPPSSTMLNQCVAVAGWGLWMLIQRPRHAASAALPLLGALLLLGLALLASMTLGSLPASLGWGSLGQIIGAALLLWAGIDAARRSQGASIAQAFCLGLVVAGVLASGVGFVQVFRPEWADGEWISTTRLVGRAVGNLRQPNHLCTLLLWAMAAAVVLHEQGVIRRFTLGLLLALMVATVELSASRTGAVGLLVLAAWGLLDRRLSRSARIALVATPVLYALSYAAMQVWGQMHQAALGAGARLDVGGLGDGASPNARTNVWRSTWLLIREQPWLGVGFGEFNFAWSLTEIPGRPVAFFDHAHNLVLHLMAELGVPLGLAVTGLVLWGLARAWRRSARAEGDIGTAARGALVMVGVVLVHSQVEYPLWYAYFLLPAAFAWGLAIGVPATDDGTRAVASDARPRRAAQAEAPLPRWVASGLAGTLAGAVLLAGGAFAVADYQRVVAIYAPPDNAGPLVERIVSAQQRSVLFAHQADYAAATNEVPLAAKALGFERATHFLLDTRLMMSWAWYLEATQRVDQARWIAERLREFDHPESELLLGPCGEKPGERTGRAQARVSRKVAAWHQATRQARASAAPGPSAASAASAASGAAAASGGAQPAADPDPATLFQCQPPQRDHGWREFAAGDELRWIRQPAGAPAAAGGAAGSGAASR